MNEDETGGSQWKKDKGGKGKREGRKNKEDKKYFYQRLCPLSWVRCLWTLPSLPLACSSLSLRSEPTRPPHASKGQEGRSRPDTQCGPLLPRPPSPPSFTAAHNCSCGFSSFFIVACVCVYACVRMCFGGSSWDPTRRACLSLICM